MKGKLKIVCIVAICLCVLGCIWFVLHERVDHGSAGTTKPQQLTEKVLGNTNNSGMVSVGTVPKTSSGGQSDLKFLDVMWPFLPERYQKMIDEAKAHGGLRAPKTFSEVAGMAELVGHITKNGKLKDFYAALKDASAKDPDNLSLLRMLVLASSIQGFDEREYEANLAALAARDTNADVLFPYAQLQLEKGDAESAYSWIQKNVSEHPEQAASTLTSSLRIFTKAKATKQKGLLVAQLKNIEVNASQADRCGGYLYGDGDLADAAFFYEKNADSKDHPFFREAAQVKLCRIKIANKVQDEQTIETLKELAINSDTPAIKAEAHRALSSLNIDLPYSTDNANNKPSDN